MRALLAAVQSGHEAIRTDGRLPERRHAAQARLGRARRHLDAVELRLASGALRRAAEHAKRTAERAAQGCRRPRWLRLVRWPVVVAVGAFDTWYFTQVFRYLTSYTGDAEDGGPGMLTAFFERFTAIVPGVVIAVTLALSSVMLLMPLRAWQESAFRPVPPNPEDAGFGARAQFTLIWAGRRLARFLWWLMPFAFVGMLLVVVGIWAGLRAKNPVPPREGYPLPSVMLLLVMLSAGAIAVKIVADDPVAEEEATARRRLTWHKGIYLWQTRRAGIMITRYESAWSDLRTLRDELLGLLRLEAVSAWEAFILRTRALHRRAGNVTALPAAPPVGLEAAEDGLVLPEFENVPQPRPELGPLHEICKLIADYPPADLLERKRILDEEYKLQITP